MVCLLPVENIFGRGSSFSCRVGASRAIPGLARDNHNGERGGRRGRVYPAICAIPQA